MNLGAALSNIFNAVNGQGGTGVQITRYPATAAGTALTASGKTTGAYKYAAAYANVKAVVAKATITGNPWRLAWIALDTLSAASLFVVKVGTGAAAAGAFTKVFGEFHFAVTGTLNLSLLNMPFITPDGATDGILADLASSNAAADDTADLSVGVAQ